MQTTPTLLIHLLGSFKVKDTQSGTSLSIRRKTRALLVYLAATGQPHPRQALADMFCQGVQDPSRALRSILSRIRQRLGSEVLLTEGNTVQFNQKAGWVDCQEFVQILDSDLASVSLESLTAAVDLYRGGFLENVNLSSSPEFELWLLSQRSRYQRLYQRGLEALVDRLIARDEFEPAISRTQELIQSNPLTEEGHARLMWLYARSGQRELALAQFEQCRQILRRELAVEPKQELLALRDEIAAGQLGHGRHGHVTAIELSTSIQKPGDFVGRTTEMDQLQHAWAMSRPRHTVVVLLEAEAGMGKTRLVQEFARTVPEANFLVGACYESMCTVPYSPWLEVLETRLDQLDDTTLEQLSAFAVDYLARLLPALARRLGRRRPPIPSTSVGELNRLFTAVAEFLFQLPQTPPLLLFLDNLQWADEASIRLFHFLARLSPPGKALLIGALRAEEAGEVPVLQSLLSDLQHHPLVHLQLSPLEPQAITELIAQLWPGLPQGYRPHVCDMLVKATGGNPLFVSEVLSELAHTSEVPSALPVPKSISELVRRRLSLLPQSSRQVIEAMAVLGSPATPAQAEQTSGRSQEETVTAVDLALRRGLLQPQTETGPVRYDFRHDLMREAVMGQLSHIRRQLLHRRAALTLEQAGASAATLAHHWQMAGNDEKECDYAVRAGEQAAAIYANDEAARYFERALALIDDPQRRSSVLYQLGEVLQILARHQEAEDVYRQALALVETTADRRAQARCQVALGRLMRLKGEYDEALARLESARTTYEALGDQQGLVQALWGMGAVRWSQLDYPRALACFREQLRIAHQLEDREGIGAAVGSMGVVYTEQGDYRQALTCLNQRLQIDLERNDQLSLAKTMGNMGIVYAEQGEYTQALACYHYLLRVTLELGDRQNVCVAVGNMIGIYTAQEQYELARRLSQQAIVLGRALNIPLYLCEYLHTSAALFAQQERYTEAVPLNEEAVSTAAQIGRTDIQLPAHLLSVRLRLATGQLTAAQATQELESLRAEWPADQEQAAILYHSWQFDNSLTRYRQQAADLYRLLYAKTPNIRYRRRYQELAGEVLPAPPTLPVPPHELANDPGNLDDYLAQVDELIADLGKE
jgi:DNA-binding SARP family transcriptional activator